MGLGSGTNGNCVYGLKMDDTNGAHLGFTDELENTCGAHPAPKCNPASNPHGKTHTGDEHWANIKAVDSPRWGLFFFSGLLLPTKAPRANAGKDVVAAPIPMW